MLYSQSGFFLNTQESKKIKFEFTSNLIILPVEVNGVTLSFVLDSGVSKPILFNLSESDSLNLKDTETFFLHGLGADGKIEALKSKNNIFKIGDAISTNQDLYVLFDNSINFTPRLGVLVHGIIGYDLFKNFVVEINYNSEYIKIYKHETFKLKNSKKWQTIPINLYRRKPYVNANVFFSEQNIKTVKLLIDTGSSDALWLFEDIKNGIIPDTERFFRDYLGKGLSGSVYGKRSKVKKFNLANYNLNDVNVSFPDPSSVDLAKMHKDRKGSLGGDILKRFNIIFDYRNQDIHLKKNSYFKNRFTYNNSGIILEHNGNMFVKERVNISRQNQPSNGYSSVRNNDKSSRAVKIDYSIDYIMRLKPAYKIVEIRETSNAYASGLRVGDIVISINKVLVYNYRLPEINQFFHDKTGTTLTMKVERDGKEKFFKFKLDDAFKINKPSN
ncbi:aspartyl protease family protein [uncultured Winogradskyella sp.]|uniref:pepsin/retropepsin-like aspartic protease family protein n=1 Tax=uncultured Winogradskyella sp. TaxID=395353 RepID=UPI00261996CB|nr:aspartyl protease family protein [uncultured Winogradskyella sp.]